MTDHSFDPEVAKIVGTTAATIYKNIKHWCAKNAANDRNVHDGKAWTYNSASAYEKQFPYLTERQIRTCLKKLIEHEFISEGNFNKEGRDRTKWYCDLRVLAILPKCNMHVTKMSEPSDQMVTPLPDKKPNIKQDICSFEEFWDAFNHKKGKEAALKVWRRKKLNLKSEDVIRGAKAYVKTRGQDPQYWKHAQGWLNDGRWEDFQPSQPSQSQQIDWEKRLKVYTENNIWLPDWGSEPGLEGCRVPASLLKTLEAQNA